MPKPAATSTTIAPRKEAKAPRDIKQIVIVHQDGGYGPNPGHRGNGPVTSVFCTL